MLNAAIGASVTLKPGNASAFLATQVVLATIQLAFGAIAVAEIPTASHSIHIMARKSYFFLGFMPAARTTLHQGGSNFPCGANYPHQALKGGYFVFVWRVGT